MHCTSEILNCKQPSNRFLSIALYSDASVWFYLLTVGGIVNWDLL